MGLYDVLTNSKFVGSVATAITTASLIGAFKYGRDYLLSLRLKKRLEEDHYTPAEIKNRVLSNRDPYVRPDCQDNNPANPEAAANRRPLFEEVDHLLGPPLIGRFTLILADTGMGKSTSLEQYYAYHWQSPRRDNRFQPIVLPLNGLDTHKLTERIDLQRSNTTVLLLDALDEDQAAIANFPKRLHELVMVAGNFRAVIVTCRTQFLADVACVPKEIDLPALPGPRGLTGGPDSKVRKLYLSPFSDAQVKRYLAVRFPSWRHPVLRIRGGRTARRFKDLMSRLLLTFIQDLASSPVEPKYSFQAYETIVNSWLQREKTKGKLATSPENLRHFCTEFAVALFTSGRDRISGTELQVMAESFGVELVPRELRSRSLLHNDAEGNWKFTHRSVMEYLLANAIVTAKDNPPWVGKEGVD